MQQAELESATLNYIYEGYWSWTNQMYWKCQAQSDTAYNGAVTGQLHFKSSD